MRDYKIIVIPRELFIHILTALMRIQEKREEKREQDQAAPRKNEY
jgi:hypothetical protein